MTSVYHVLGVDGGGTGCRIALCTADGTPLSRATGGPANFTTDPGGTIGNVLDALYRVVREAALTDEALARCAMHIGLAGVMNGADRKAVAEAIPFGRVTVSDDRATSVAGALGDGKGILAAIGTGTIVAAQANGHTRYFGGWGHHLADQASGGWLGRKAVRRAMKVHDGLARPSSLTEAIMNRFGGDPIAAVHFAARARPGDYASFAPVIIETARDGDPNALSLLRKGVDYLHACFRTAALEGDWALCLAGGIGPHYAPYLAADLHHRIRPPSGTALDGALRLARRNMDDDTTINRTGGTT